VIDHDSRGDDHWPTTISLTLREDEVACSRCLGFLIGWPRGAKARVLEPRGRESGWNREDSCDPG
jgi:hypothetical protein